jgi:15-cis-phytoene synthase
MSDAFAHCEQLTREADKDRFLATLFAPAQRRGPLFALYAFNVEVTRVRDAIRDPMAGEVRLQWWHDAIERPGAGEARANPVAAALLDTVVRFRLPVPRLLGLIAAHRFDLYVEPMPTVVALETYCEQTSAALFELAGRILDGRADDIATPARHAGIAAGLVGLLRALPQHLARGQLTLPLDLLERHGARPADVLARRATPELVAALAEIRAMARTHLDAFRQSDVSPALASAFLPATLIDLYLARLDRQRDPFGVADVPQWRRQRRLWRAARRIPTP